MPLDSNASSLASPNRQADKIKSLLASYYNETDTGGGADSDDVEEIQPADDCGVREEVVRPVGKTSQRVPGDEGEGQSEDPSSIDQIKATQHLDDLLVTEKELATEIGNSDIELRSIVYDSYCAFMKASDTVRDLQRELNDVETSLETLDMLLSEVGGQSQAIDDRLNAHQNVIFEMHEKRKILQGVELLLRLGDDMKNAVLSKDYEMVVEMYKSSKDALDMYAPRYGAVMAVKGEVDTYRREVLEDLQENLDGNAMKISVELDEDIQKLVPAYLEKRKRVLMEERGMSADTQLETIREAIETCQAVDTSSTLQLRVETFVREAIEHCTRAAIEMLIEEELISLAAAGGFDTHGVETDEKVEYDIQDQHLYQTFDSFLQYAGQFDGILGNTVATEVVSCCISETLGLHLRSAFAVVEAGAFKSIKEMVMRLLLNDGGSARFLKVLIKSLEVSTKQDFGLVEKVVGRWVSWNGIPNTIVLDCFDTSCRDSLAHLCHCVEALYQGRTCRSYSPEATPEFLEKQFAVPASLSRPEDSTPITALCLSSSILKVRAALVDEETKMSEKTVQATADHLIQQYIETLRREIIESISSSFENDVLMTQTSPPTSPSTIAKKVAHLVTQVDSDCSHTNWDIPDNAEEWSLQLLKCFVDAEISAIDEHGNGKLSKAAFQQIQVDVVSLKNTVKLISVAAAPLLDELLAQAVNRCDEPVLINPETLECFHVS
jgi:hypothetical protein